MVIAALTSGLIGKRDIGFRRSDLNVPYCSVFWSQEWLVSRSPNLVLQYCSATIHAIKAYGLVVNKLDRTKAPGLK